MTLTEAKDLLYVRDQLFNTQAYKNLLKDIERLWNKHIPTTQLSVYNKIKPYISDDEFAEETPQYIQPIRITLLDNNHHMLKELEGELADRLLAFTDDIEKLNDLHNEGIEKDCHFGIFTDDPTFNNYNVESFNIYIVMYYLDEF